MSGAASRRKGHDCERAVAAWLRDQGFPDAETTRARLGHDGATAPGDVTFHPLITLEVKNVAKAAWPAWCRQAASEAHQGTVPVVVRKTAGSTDVGAWATRVQGAGWLEAVTDPDVYPLSLPSRAFGSIKVDVDGLYWYATMLADVVEVLHAIDDRPPSLQDENPR